MRFVHFGLLALVLVVLLVTVPAEGLASGLSKGVTEILIHNGFSYVRYSAEDYGYFAGTTEWELSFGIGRCVTDMVEFSGGFGMMHRGLSTESHPWDTDFAFGPRGFMIVNLPAQGRIIPYFEAGAGIRFFAGNVYGDQKTGVTVPILGGGIRILVGNSASVNVGVTYQHVINAMGEEHVTSNEFLTGVGVSLLL